MLQLREGTSDLHAQVESRVPLTKPEPSRAEYVWFLQKMLGFAEPVERALEAMIRDYPALIGAPESWKAPWLSADLDALGGHLPAGAGARRPSLLAAPTLTDPAHGWGALYVLEGASLGGQVLRRHLATQAWWPHGPGARYLAGYGARTAEVWRNFRERAENFATTSVRRDAMVAGARETFTRLSDWLVLD